MLCGHLKVFVSIAVTASSFQSTNFPGENLKFVKMQVFIYNKQEWKFSEDQRNSSYLLSLIRRISSNTYITAVRTFLQFCKRYLLMFEKHFWFIVRLIHRLFEAVNLKVFLIDIIFDIQFMAFYFLIIWFLTGRSEFITSKFSTNCYERYFDSCYDMIIPIIFWTNI